MEKRLIFSPDTFGKWARRYRVGFPCLTCTENCCTDYLIYITHADLVQIQSALPEVPLSEYVDVTSVSVDDYPEVRIEGRPVRLVIKKAQGSGRCVFLASGVNLCAIHGFSPYICRMYPFQIPYDDYRELEFRTGVKCREPFLCPEEQIPELIQMGKTFWRHDLPRYAALVEQWNRLHAEKNLEAFVHFLLVSSRGERGAVW